MDDSSDLTDLPALLHHSLRLVPDPRYQRRPKHTLTSVAYFTLTKAGPVTARAA